MGDNDKKLLRKLGKKRPKSRVGKTEKESEGPVGGPIPGFKGTKRTLGPAGAPVNKFTGEVFRSDKWTKKWGGKD